MRVAAVQMALAWEDRATNHARARDATLRARDAGAHLVVLPEMFATGFSLRPAVTAEDEDGPTSRFLRDLAREAGVAVLAGLVTRAPGGRGRNTALAVGADGAVLARYVKCHLFSFAGEHEVHEAGPGPAPFQVAGVRVSPFICYDLRFPELFRREAPSTDLFVVVASWPAPRQRHWDLLLPARALENLAWVVGVNRVGDGGGLAYTGGSAAYDPLAEPVGTVGDREETLLVDVDPARVAEVRARLPFLADRRF